MIRPETKDFLEAATGIGWECTMRNGIINLSHPLESGRNYTFSVYEDALPDAARQQSMEFCVENYLYAQQNSLHSTAEVKLEMEAQEISEHLENLNKIFNDTIHDFLVKNLFDKAEELGWSYTPEVEDCIYLSKHSPAGEAFGISVSVSDIVSDVREHACDFDIEDHVFALLNAKRNGIQGIPDVRTLVEDADAISEMLRALADGFEAVENLFFEA